MSYSHFTAVELKQKFGIQQDFVGDLFSSAQAVEPSALLLETLERGLRLALLQGSEKARSEMVIAPVILEVYSQTANISFFSGIDFPIDESLGLNGVCDFLISRSPDAATLETPVVIAVEAKQDDFRRGINQCLAEMVAARIFNERNGVNLEEIYGCVTTGDVWRFLVLRGTTALIESASFDVRDDLTRILGILQEMALGTIKTK